MPGIYESQRLLSEYLLFHYGDAASVLPRVDGPRGALDFPVRTVTTFLDSSPRGRALDLGCAVGRSAFELSRFCTEVVAVDYSRLFVAAAESIRSTGRLDYSIREEGHLTRELTARRPEGTRPARITFEHGDAMQLRPDLGDFDVVHAANLLCRLPDPARLLARLPALVGPGGTLLLTTPCTWLEEFTPPDRWPPGATFAWLCAALEPHFLLKNQADLPFLIREHARKYQWSVALGTAWERLQ